MEESINEIIIIVNIENNNNEEKIRIFGENFVNKYKDKCKIVYGEEEFELQEYIELKDNSEKIEFKLKGKNNITDMSYMFSCCNKLTSIEMLSKNN